MKTKNNLKNEYFVQNITSIKSINQSCWDLCAGETNPFVSYDFLQSLEESGCVSNETGWMPFHLIVNDSNKNLVACAPLYFKNHSQGEYIFDHSWANALEGAGGNYYPKLIIAIPFSPVSGPRLLIKDKNSEEKLKKIMLDRLIEIAKKNNLSSIHINFTGSKDNNFFYKTSFLERIGIQFHWKNNLYENFDQFLTSLSSRKRKSILKERKNSLKKDINIFTFTGQEINEEHIKAFYNFYIDTTSKKWGIPYLNYEFFSLLYEKKIREKMVLIMAKRNSDWVAGAINFRGKTCLYGRYWGSLENHKFLHFEICYYQAIDFAIKNKIEYVQAGAQGPHKLSRGYLPNKTYSWHWINNEVFRKAIEDYLTEEKQSVERNIEYFMNQSPYKKN